jgi:hypothetical protein
MGFWVLFSSSSWVLLSSSSSSCHHSFSFSDPFRTGVFFSCTPLLVTGIIVTSSSPGSWIVTRSSTGSSCSLLFSSGKCGKLGRRKFFLVLFEIYLNVSRRNCLFVELIVLLMIQLPVDIDGFASRILCCVSAAVEYV